MNNNPLVSIVVITYHSSKFVLETLESAKKQTYKSIELIVSDDGSTDNTVALCRQWLTEQNSHFVRTQLISVEQNTGTSANCNRGVKAAKGEWIKLIGGDDLLNKKCISSNIRFIEKNPEARFVFSRMEKFNGINSPTQNSVYPTNDTESFFFLSGKEQYNSLLQHNFIANTPTSFIHSAVFNKLDFFDEEYRLFEDFPFWIKALQNGYRLYYFSDVTVKYRMGESVSNIKSVWVNKNYFESKRTHFGDQIATDLSKINYTKYIERYLYYKRTSILIKLFNNKKNFLSLGFNYCAIKVCNIIVHLTKFKSIKV